MSENKSCSKCGGPMAAGFTVDRGYGGAVASTWQDGAPRKSFWTGVKLSKRDQIEITTWRCERCGLLESYAA